jgi:putative ABC transport system substrate-binding protein
MRRREFITLLGSAVATWPRAARAQQAAMPVIGVLISTTVASFAERLAAFRHGVNESGFVEGQNVTIEYRSAEGHDERLPALAADLVRRQVTVIATASTAAALALKTATTTIPIVFSTGADPVEIGLVASLNRPGGNLTGVSFFVNKLVAKRLELLSALVPGASTIGMLVDPTNPNTEADTRDAQAAADVIGRTLLVIKAATEREIELAYAAVVQQRVSALFVAAHINLTNWHDQIVALAARHAVAVSYPARDYVAAGGLMSYGPNQRDVYRQVGVYVGRILKGEKPADLPVMQPTKFDLVINLKTAKALGIEVPAGVLAIADEVIE